MAPLTDPSLTKTHLPHTSDGRPLTISTVLTYSPSDEDSEFFELGDSASKTSPMSRLPPNTDNDPFAGMNSHVNYQQEIERIKASVTKNNTPKRSQSRPKSAHFECPSQWHLSTRHSLMDPSFGPLSPDQQIACNMPSSAPTSPPSASMPTSPFSAVSPALPFGQEDKQRVSVISDEAKARFFDFVRSRAGGLQSDGDWTSANENSSSRSWPKPGSLWATQTPWMMNPTGAS